MAIRPPDKFLWSLGQVLQGCTHVSVHSVKGGEAEGVPVGLQVPVPSPVQGRGAATQSPPVWKEQDQAGREAAIAAASFLPTRAPVRVDETPISAPADRPVQTPNWWTAPPTRPTTARQKQEVGNAL